jgi:hypothetical protein
MADRAVVERVGALGRVRQHELAAAHLRAAVDVVRLRDGLVLEGLGPQDAQRRGDEIRPEVAGRHQLDDAEGADRLSDRLGLDLRAAQRLLDVAERLVADDQLVGLVARLLRAVRLVRLHLASPPCGLRPEPNRRLM